MIVPIFLYAHTQQVQQGPDWANSSNDSASLAGSINATWSNRSGLLQAGGGDNSSAMSCNIYWPENEYMNGQAAFTLYTFTLAFAIPLILILVFYILVIRKLQVYSYGSFL